MNQISDLNNDVALFIDWENFKISLAVGHRDPNVSALKEEVSNYGRVVVAKAYADWVTRSPELRGASQFTNDPPALYAAGIEPVYVPTRLPLGSSSSSSNRTTRVKNSVDVKMTADCIECAHAYSNIETFVLVSGDSDFIHVVNTLRTMGKKVIVIGVSWSTSRRLADQVDGLILYDSDIDPITSAEAVSTNNDRGVTRLTNPGRNQLPEVIRVIEDLIRAERQSGRTPLLTSLKQRTMRRIPGFDEKNLGFAGFKKLMERVAQEGNVKLVTVGLVDWVIMSHEPDPNSEITSEPSPPISSIEESELISEESDDNKSSDSVIVTSISDIIGDIDLPKGPDDGQNEQRVSDLIVMANHLETRDGVSHVAFNFLAIEICSALQTAINERHEEITGRWSTSNSRTFITRLLRSLGNAGVFKKGWHTGKDQDTGKSRRRSTFNLDHTHQLVKTVLQEQTEISGEYIDIQPEDPNSTNQDILSSNEGVSRSEDTSPFGISKVIKLFSRS
jgi:uncharacterized LabA/DUF88 family protein